MISVMSKVLGGSAKANELSDEATVGDLKEILGLSKHTASVNGDSVDDDYELSDGDYVNFAEAVKGG